MTRYIVTHTHPDMDAVCCAWLLQRYGGFDDAAVRFVNTGAPDADTLAGAAAVVDTGREYDPARWRFDHHQLPGHAANETCAALQVYNHLTSGGDILHPLFWLDKLVALVWAGDTGRTTDGADWSRLVGLHAIYSGGAATGDADRLAWGYALLDSIAATLKARDAAGTTLARHTVYTSRDGLIVALKDAPPHATRAAHEAGARLVVFQSNAPTPDGGTTHSIGIMRGGEHQEPHVGQLILAVMESTIGGAERAMYAELASWYRHEAGFFAGRGTAKAPRPDPVLVDVAEVAALIDSVWVR